MKVTKIHNKELDKKGNEELNKMLSNLQIETIGKGLYKLSRNGNSAVFRYSTNSFKDFITSLADLYIANGNERFGFTQYTIDKYQPKIKQLFTQKEIDLIPLS